MLITITAEILGGYWGIRSKYLKTKNPILKIFYDKFFRLYIEERGSSIDLRTEVANEPIFPHRINGIFIASSSKIGRNCVIYHQVTIGVNMIPGSKNQGAPIIGDDVYIGAGAKIIGGIKIGNNVRIGANAVVFADVPDNATVVANAGRVIEKEAKQNNRFYRYSNKLKGIVYIEDGKEILETNDEILRLLGAR